MIKRFEKKLFLFLLVLLLNSSFHPPSFYLKYKPSALKEHTVSNDAEEYSTNVIYLYKDFTGFKELLAFKESGGSYSRTNKYGYMGKYQFNLNTLKMFNVRNALNYIDNPELQEKVFLLNVQRNKWILRKDIKWFIGSNINGIEITESGIIAAAHLSGPGNVKKYLRGSGKEDFKDSFGTSISSYMNYFKNFDLSSIKPIRNPKI
ncbi:MAG: peptidoglycan-binding protein LysM [Flavobacteriaceae bacterium]|nr:peptidoglycan-binding protein LysM [Flavobacteriaceae bacterium]|tara:strand:+ start:3276 stop:3890 length:615 start_codon:yes stop_codon:yes gene_type:complete